MGKTQSFVVVFVMGVVSFLFGGCGKQSGVKTEYNLSQPKPESHSQIRLERTPEITSESEEGFHDMVFYVEDFKKLADGNQIIRISGNYMGNKVGLEIILRSNWKESSFGKNIGLASFQGVVTFHSVGAESDTLLSAMDELYGTKSAAKKMSRETNFTGISLGGDPRDLTKGSVKIKIFYESDQQSRYAELFTNIELENHKAQINEKDESYRSAVIQALKSSGPGQD